MSDYNEQLSRMKALYNYGKVEENTKKYSTHSLEYHEDAADGRTYGIIRENNKYYIKCTDPKKAMVAENYEYLGGFNNKKDYEYNSYANALKNFELKLESIRQANIGEQDVENLHLFEKEVPVINESADAMRKDLARYRQIMYNSSMIMNEEAIGKTPFSTQPEAAHENSGDEDAPFTNAAKPDMEFDGKKSGCPKCEGDPFVKGTNGTKAEKGKDVNVDGSVAGMHPAGGKVVRVNEGCCGTDECNLTEEGKDDKIEMLRKEMEQLGFTPEQIEDAINALPQAEEDMGEEISENPFNKEGELGDGAEIEEGINLEGEEEPEDDEDFEGEDFDGEEEPEDDEDMPEGDEDFEDEEGEDFDDEEEPEGEEDFEGEEGEDFDDEDMPEGDEEDVDETDPESIQAEIDRLQGILDDLKSEEPEDVDGEESFGDEEEPEGEEDFDDEDMPEGDEEPEGEEDEQLDEAKRRYMSMITESVVKDILKEDELHVFGQHPGYRKKPMNLPATGEDKNQWGEDWNDESVHNEEPFGKEIGDGKPFDKVVDKITEKVMEALKKK